MASGVMAFAALGDAMLYIVLPIYGLEMGFTALYIGILLSANRFVRIISNTYIANIVNRIGMKKVLIATSILAVITTMMYGLKMGFIPFLIARLLWGLSYSGQKIATLNYAAEVGPRSGLAFGLTQGIKSLGVLFAYWACPILVISIGVVHTFFLMAAIGLLGISLAIALPKYNFIPHPDGVKTRSTFSPSPINLLVFILSITIDGILVVILSSLLLSKYPDPDQLLAFVAFYLLLKRLFLTCLSMLSGIVSLKISPIKLFNVSVFFCLLGTLLIALNYLVPGIIIAFLFNAVVVTFSPIAAMQQQGANKNALQAISGTSTWWDFGAAVGALVGIYIEKAMGAQNLFLVLSFIILIFFINFIFRHGSTNRATV